MTSWCGEIKKLVRRYTVDWNHVFLNSDDDGIVIFVGDSMLGDELSWQFMQNDYQVFVIYTTTDYTPVRSSTGSTVCTGVTSYAALALALKDAFAMVPNATTIIDARDPASQGGPAWLYDPTALPTAVENEINATRYIVAAAYNWLADMDRGYFCKVSTSAMFVSPQQGAAYGGLAAADLALWESLQYELGTPWKTDINAWPLIIAPGPTRPIGVATNNNARYGTLNFGGLGSRLFPYVGVEDLATQTIQALEMGSIWYNILPSYAKIMPWLRIFSWEWEDRFRRVTRYDIGLDT
jgi:hypothetical protein